MAKYHNSPNGPRLCKAEKEQCPYGRAGGEHYSSQAEAQAAYEEKMTQAFGVTKKFNKVETTRQNHYQRIDRFKAYVTKVTDTATQAKAEAMSKFSAEGRRKMRAAALAKAQRAGHRMSAATAKQVAAAVESFNLAKEQYKAEFLADPRGQAALAAMRQSKQTLVRAKASIADSVLHARAEGHRMLADGQAVATYANYSLKKRFFSFVAKSSQSAADKANFILESKYTRQVPPSPDTEAPARHAAFERPRYIIPERAARAFVVSPSGESTAVTFRGVPEEWTKAPVGAEKKEHALA